MINRVVHPKVKWAAVASLLVAVLTALAGSLGASAPSWVASLLTAVAGAVAGFQAPSGPSQDPEAPNA